MSRYRRTKAELLASSGQVQKAFNLQQAAAICGLSTDTFRALAGNYGVDGRRVSRTLILFTEGDLETLLERLPKVKLADTQNAGEEYRTKVRA